MTSVRALDELVAQELVAPVDRQPPRRYQLLGAPRLVAADALTAPDALTPSSVPFTPAGSARGKTSGRRSQPLTGPRRRPKRS